MTASKKTSKGFTDEERAAMKERDPALTAEERANRDRAAGERDVLAKIAAMQESDRAMRSGSMSSSKPRRGPSRRRPGTECPRMPTTTSRLLLPKRAEIQLEVPDARLQRPVGPRRGRDVADRLRA
jgi:hypothetical protein